MRSLLALSGLTLIALLAAPEAAKAASPGGSDATGAAAHCDPRSQVCLNQLCNLSAADRIGVTSMDYDQKNLIACLKNDEGEYRWKSMSPVTLTSGGSIGIGTTQPLATLDVAGSVTFGNNHSLQLTPASFMLRQESTDPNNGAYGLNLAIFHNPATNTSQQAANFISAILNSPNNITYSGPTRGLWAASVLGQYGSGSMVSSTGIIEGLRGETYMNSLGSAYSMIGVRSIADMSVPGHIDNMTAFHGTIQLRAPGTVENGYGAYIAPPLNPGNAVVTNNYGLYVGNQNGAATNSFNIYSEGSGKNYFGGMIETGDSVKSAGNIQTGANVQSNGNMEAGGYVKVGVTTAACSADKAGAIRYNAGIFEGCNGSAWTSLGGTAGSNGTSCPPCPLPHPQQYGDYGASSLPCGSTIVLGQDSYCQGTALCVWGGWTTIEPITCQPRG